MDGMVRLTGPFVPCHPKKYFYNFYPKKSPEEKRITPKKYLRNMGGYGWVARCAWLVLLSHAIPSSCP